MCNWFAHQLHRQLNRSNPNLTITNCNMACFRIQLCDGYMLFVSIPSDKNRHIATNSAGNITVETALFKNDGLVYDDELGYSDILCHEFDGAVILAEYERLMMALLNKQ